MSTTKSLKPEERPVPSQKEQKEENGLRIMDSHGIKPTAMRLLVFRELEKARHPISLKELEERMVTAERSTIFRTLTLLYEHHIVHAIEDGSGAIKYELCHSSEQCNEDDDMHPHFYCEQCHRTFCLLDTPLPHIQLPEGYRPMAINYLIKGICAKCGDRSLSHHPNNLLG